MIKTSGLAALVVLTTGAAVAQSNSRPVNPPSDKPPQAQAVPRGAGGSDAPARPASEKATLSAASQNFVNKAMSGGQFELQASQLAVEKANSPDVKSFAQRMIDDHRKVDNDLQQVLREQNVAAPVAQNDKPANDASTASSGSRETTTADNGSASPTPMMRHRHKRHAAMRHSKHHRYHAAYHATGRSMRRTASADKAMPATRTAGMQMDRAQAADLNKLRKASSPGFDQMYIDGQKRAHTDAIGLFRNYSQSGDNPRLKQFAGTTLPVLETHQKQLQAIKLGPMPAGSDTNQRPSK